MSPLSTLDLLARAHDALADAYAARGTAQRHRGSQLAALRAAAAVLATRGLGAGASAEGREGALARPRDPWPLLARHAPELAEWADYFAVVGERTVVLTTSGARIGVREADDLLRAAQAFVDQVRPSLGLPPVPGSTATGSESIGLAPTHPTSFAESSARESAG